MKKASYNSKNKGKDFNKSSSKASSFAGGKRHKTARGAFADQERSEKAGGSSGRRHFDKPKSYEAKSYGAKSEGATKSYSGKKTHSSRDRDDSRPFSKPARSEGSRPKSKDARSKDTRDFRDRKKGNYNDRPRRDDRPKAPRPAQTPQAPAPVKPSFSREGQLIWGLHAVSEAWMNAARNCYHLHVTAAALETLQDIIEQGMAELPGRPSPSVVEKAALDALLPQGTVHQGVVLDTSPLPLVTLDDFLGQDENKDIVVVLDQVSDPHNVGAILRSAAAFGAGAVIVSERGSPSTTGVVAKTACGGAEHVPLIQVVNIARALEMLKEENYWCIGLAEEGESTLEGCSLATGRIALVLGAEGDGLRRLTREHCDELVRLPTQGPIASLNVSNAAALALYETRRQKK